MNCGHIWEEQQLLENFLWPSFGSVASQDCFGAAADAAFKGESEGISSAVAWALLTALLCAEKIRQRVDPWPILGVSTAEISVLQRARGGDQTVENSEIAACNFRLLVNYSWLLLLRYKAFNVSADAAALLFPFLISCYASLGQSAIRRACMPLCSPYAWTRLAKTTVLQQQGSAFEQPLKVAQRKVKSVEKKHGTQRIPFDSPLTLPLDDRLILLARDAVHELLCNALRQAETTLPSLLQGNMPGEFPVSRFLLIERCLEFLIDLMSQILTRQFVSPLLASHEFIIRMRSAALLKHPECELVTKLLALLEHSAALAVDELTCKDLDPEEEERRHYQKWENFQRLLFTHMKHVEPLKKLSLGAIGHFSSSPKALRQTLEPLTCACLLQVTASLRMLDSGGFGAALTDLAHTMGIESLAQQEQLDKLEECKDRAEYAAMQRMLREVLVRRLTKTGIADARARGPLLPTERLMWDPAHVPAETYTAETPLALPKLGLQFLNLHDYLTRNFELFRLESTFKVRQDIEEAIWRLQPSLGFGSGDESVVMSTQFGGTSQMAAPIEGFSVTLVASSAVDSNVPSEVQAEFSLDLKRVSKDAKIAWNELRRGEVMFLIAVKAPTVPYTNRPEDLENVTDFPEAFGVVGVRGCEILEIKDEEGKPLTDWNEAARKPSGTVRHFRVALEPQQYYEDLHGAAEAENDVTWQLDLYSMLNVVVRRSAAGNNFKAVLETIRQLLSRAEQAAVPDWLRPLLLGFGDPRGAFYGSLLSESEDLSLDLYDTFLDLDHLQDALKDKAESVEITEDFNPGDKVMIEFSRERRVILPPEGAAEGGEGYPRLLHKKLIVKPYRESKGAKQNEIRFTRLQTEAIRSGLCRGLTMIVGPPGTGKTDTAVQIISLLLRNYPNERILVVAHSNRSLNDLFTKVAALDVDPAYLVRLGMGEKELRQVTDVTDDTAPTASCDFSRAGRLRYLLERRQQTLNAIARLAVSIGVSPGAVAGGCAAAISFCRTVVGPRVQRYRAVLTRLADEETMQTTTDLETLLKEIRGEDVAFLDALSSMQLSVVKPADSDDMPGFPSVEKIKAELPHTLASNVLVEKVANGEISMVEALFPFTAFMQWWKHLVFSPSEVSKNIAEATNAIEALENLFRSCEQLRAVEVLRSLRVRGSFLVGRFAKVVALTCTHAGIARASLIKAGLQFSSLVMEEAAQVTEVETLIPLLCQADTAERLKRVVLLGDHHQLPPIVQNRGFQQFCNFDQSMFARFVKLGVPYVQLDQQGRCRQSLRSLFSWAYQVPPLLDLPNVQQQSKFLFAIPGFAYTWQFINMEDYEGHGERCPRPHYFQNKGEAEMLVCIYMYMRLLGIPSSRISILTTYNGQKELMKETLQKRCSWNPLFGWPHAVSTVDKYQGQQNDFILLSLVRTRHVGHIRDIRRMTVALSRARLGLWVVGRMAVFERVPELRPTLERLKQRPLTLQLMLSETSFEHDWGKRLEEGEVCSAEEVSEIPMFWKLLGERAKSFLSF